jgi:hypothetical protein
LFLSLARSAGNPEHVAALEGLTERLQPAQRLEEMFLDETEAETAEILHALRAEDRRALRKSLVQYHRRRERIVPELLTALLHDGRGNPIACPMTGKRHAWTAKARKR